jgi:hypothetical protein
LSLRWAATRPEPARFWVRFAPRDWPGANEPWLDLARGRLGDAGEGGDFAALAGQPLDDVAYLPPVPPRLATERDALALDHLARGTPVLLQLLPGESTTVEGAQLVVDALPAVLAGDLSLLDRLPEGAGVAFPLLAGLTDDPELWAIVGERMTAAEAAWVHGIAPQLSPVERRRLARDDAFEALFHRDAPSERDFSRSLMRFGFTPFLPRPLPRPPIQLRENRRIAGLLGLAAEIWLRLGRPAEAGQALFRASRWADATRYDLASLCREGHLGVIDELAGLAGTLVEQAVARSGESELAAMIDEYLAPEPAKPKEETAELAVAAP